MMMKNNYPTAEQGISFRSIFPNYNTFKEKLILRNEYDDKVLKYSWELLSKRYWDRVFWWTNGGICESRFSSVIEPYLKMQKVYNEYVDGTNYNDIYNSNAFANYEEEEELDIDNEDNEDILEKKGNRTMGSKDVTKSKTFSVNELINRETRLNDYLIRYVDNLFSHIILRRVYEKNR